MTLHSDLRRALHEAMLSLGSQAKLAEALGADQATVSRWLAGRQGMEVGYALKFAILSGIDAATVLRWAGFDPHDYLPSKLVMSPEASEIESRRRVLDWHKRRLRIAEPLRESADRSISDLLDVYIAACQQQRPPPRATRKPARARS